MAKEKTPYDPEIKRQDGIFLVQSERKKDHFYDVNLRTGMCTCVWFSLKGRDCKHILAARKWIDRNLPFTVVSE